MSDYPARLYAAVHDGNPGDVEFYRQRCAGARTIVELGCGDARVLAAVAALPGVERALGVDIDPELLDLARARFDAAGLGAKVELELIAADMRTVELPEGWRGQVDRVVIPYGGLYCLLDEAAVRATLARVAAMLAPDGRLILDAWAADDFHAEADPDDQDPSWLEHVKVLELDGDRGEEERWEVLERSAWDKATQRIDATYLHFRVGDEDPQPIEGKLPQRYVLTEQLRALLAEAGLELVELLGDFAGTPYDADAELMIAVARPARRGSSTP